MTGRSRELQKCHPELPLCQCSFDIESMLANANLGLSDILRGSLYFNATVADVTCALPMLSTTLECTGLILIDKICIVSLRAFSVNQSLISHPISKPKVFRGTLHSHL